MTYCNRFGAKLVRRRKFHFMYRNSTMVFVVLVVIFAGLNVWQYTQAPVYVSSVVRKTVATKININTASKAHLQLLPGVGPALAGQIILTRKKLGKFSSAKDLLKVHGIGPALLEKIEPFIIY